MSTSWLSRCGPGVFACRPNVTPSFLPSRKRIRLRPGGGPPASSNSSCGGSRSSTTASVTEWRERLADAHVPRHARPAPRVDLQAGGDVRLDRRVRVDAGLLAVADVLPAHHAARVDRLHRRQHLGLLVLQERRVGIGGRLHRQQRDDLQQVVLEHVADRPDALVEAAPPLDADRLGHRDLHAAHVVPVPDRLEQHVREPEHEEVLDRLLAEVVVDAEDALLGEDARAASCSARSADCRSRPNGFSTTIRPRSLSPTDASASATVGNIVGGIAM